MKKSLSLGVAFLALTLTGPVYADSMTITLGSQPPAPPVQAEVVTPPPGPAEFYAWHKGHWRWIDETYVWVPGHWVKRPRPMAVWVEPRWIQAPGGWRFVEGHWQ